MTGRLLRLLAAAGGTVMLAGCASTHAARSFSPASPDDVRRALAAWSSARARAASLPASRLLYDAKLGAGGAPSVPGTLAVTYDGTAVVTASLTGPFGSPVAEYRGGTITGKDRGAFVVDPDALRAVLSGVWNDAAPSVEGSDGGQCRLVLSGETEHAVAILDLASERVVSLDLRGPAGRLVVRYSGEASPWPSRLTMEDEATRKSLGLKLVAIERGEAPESASP